MAHHREEDLFVVGQRGDEPDEGHEGEDDDGPEGNEVGREGDEDVGLVRDDVSAIEANAKPADPAEAEVDEHRVGEFVP